MKKELIENAVYLDVLEADLILPKKNQYNMEDFKCLIEEGWNQLDARFIIICSAAYHKTKTSSIFETEEFLFDCIENKVRL